MMFLFYNFWNILFLGLRSQYHIYFVPLRSVACEQILEDEGVLNLLSIGEYHLELVPLDSDLLSLELSDVYRQVTQYILYF